MIDSHCHLDLYPDPIAVAKRCDQAGVTTLAMTNLPSHFGQGIQHLQGFKNIRIALGMHPLYADRHAEEYSLFDKYLDLTSYIGEVGLDFSRIGLATKKRQIKSFDYILSKVRGKKKLLSLHSRGAESDTLTMLKKHQINLAIFHWYTGSASILKTIAESGYYFSVNPEMIRSNKGQTLIKQIPRNQLLTETDGPYVQYNNRIVEPADVKVVINFLSKAWGIAANDVQQQIKHNFQSLLKPLR
ncbi:TatD family hydrolase [Pontibacter sp. Tf4]|uniref:Qat anti-phage system TatD family nuclease QatD n=1 Tax=Pontibacter sp. Tf4 TaxID=2761620 RepID=UPI001626D803|nr:Qat anti-phage system TatD family nuclease QatD [Pontibacter sp. Tf4]MBB6609685.1 TatD family hydrolase [Pontibacter sp. Tf4]